MMTAEEIDKKTPYSKMHSGSEGTVYEVGDKAIKLFKEYKSEEFYEEKLPKVIELMKMDLATIGFIAPEQLVYGEKGNFRGYSMELIDTKMDVSDVCYKYGNEYTIKEKIDYLLKVQELMKKIHKLGFVLNDCALWNFLVDKNDKVYGIDTDNFQFKGFDTNTDPGACLSYYQGITNTNLSTQESDKFQFGLHAITSLMEYPISPESIINSIGKPDLEYLTIKINNLQTNDEVKKDLLNLISSTKEKQWIGDTLLKLDNQHEKFIKS